LGFTCHFEGHNPLKFMPGDSGEGYVTQTTRFETSTFVESNHVLVRDEEGAFVRVCCYKAPLELNKQGTSNTPSACIGRHANAMDQHSVCTWYMSGHGLRSEGGL
jgi:hypothetical protein